MKTLPVCVLFLMFAIASSITSPPIVNRGGGYYYNLDPRKHYLKVSRPSFHPIVKAQKPQISEDSISLLGQYGSMNILKVTSKPVHPNVKPVRPQIEGSSPRVIGLDGLKYFAAKSDTPVILEVAYFLVLGVITVGIFIYCLPCFFFLKELLIGACTMDIQPPMEPEEIIIQHM